MEEITKKIEVLPLEQDFYINIQLWENNYIYVGGAYKTKAEAMHCSDTTKKDAKTKIIKITLSIKDFE